MSKPLDYTKILARIATALEKIAESCDNDSEAWDAASCADHVDDAEPECMHCCHGHETPCTCGPKGRKVEKGKDAEPEKPKIGIDGFITVTECEE